MEGWDYWIGKKVFIILKNKRNYSGTVVKIDPTENYLVFISIIDKFNQRVTFVNSEIDVIQEERVDNGTRN